jgi:AraC-like DNA-binding protein
VLHTGKLATLGVLASSSPPGIESRLAAGILPRADGDAPLPLQRDSSLTSVTAVAMNFGFWHLGRFAEEYRSLFGEAPRTTLVRPLRS